MANQIPIEEALRLVDFEFFEGAWRVMNVKCDVEGNVEGNVQGSVEGNVRCSVRGNIYVSVEGNVWGNVGSVRGTINGRKWQFIETPKEKLKRLIQEGANKAQLLEAFNQLENNQ